MRAAVVREFGRPPRCEELPAPSILPDELPLAVRASALTRLTQGVASGHHYTSPKQLPAGVGTDGVGTLPDGRRVYAMGARAPYGFFAELAPVRRDVGIPVPEGLDDAVAAALPNAALAGWRALVHRARFRAGERVLVLGATGISGGLAVQIAKHLGAARVVAAGRDAAALRDLPRLGADAVVSLEQGDAELAAALVEAAGGPGYDVILDFLWGHPAEVVIGMHARNGEAEVVPRTRFVSIGAMAGGSAAVPSAALRSSGLEILGAGIGSVPTSATLGAIPTLLGLARDGVLSIETERVPLDRIESVWDRPGPSRRRLVVVP